MRIDDRYDFESNLPDIKIQRSQQVIPSRFQSEIVWGGEARTSTVQEQAVV